MLSEIMNDLDSYPILDEDDYSNRQYEAGLSGIRDAMHMYERSTDSLIDLPEGYEYELYRFFSESDEYDICDGETWPDDDQLVEACMELGWIKPEYLSQEDRMEYEVKKLAQYYEDHKDEFQPMAFIQGLTLEAYARACLAGMTWEQEGQD